MARFGTAGASELDPLLDGRMPAVVAERLGIISKKATVLCGSCDTGDPSIDEVSGDVVGESMKVLEMLEKSESLPELMEAPEDEALRLLMSGALKALTFVVEINSVGREMRFRSIVPGKYRPLPSRDCPALL